MAGSERRAARPWLRRTAILLASLAALEAASYAAMRAAGIMPALPFREMYRTSSCLKANDFNFRRYARSAEDADAMLNTVPHPFFGFTTNPQRTAPEFRGLLVGGNYENELRYRILLGDDPRPVDTFTIGVFGASVAEAFVDHIRNDDTFAERLKAEIPALRDKTIVIRPMAIGSSRQPAQLAIATQYMELLDLTINLDGFSEVSVVQHPKYPVEFPMFSDVFYSGDDPSSYLRLRAGEEVCLRLSNLPQSMPLVASSNFYYLLWHSVSKRLNASLYARAPVTDEASSKDPFSVAQQREIYAAYYRKYTRAQHQVLSANGVRAYFFLQPNQWVPDTKPFSTEEKALLTNYPAGQEIGMRYGLLREEIRQLHDEGVRAFDLTGVFAEESRTVYIDACCHVNELGNELLANRIADDIVHEENARR
jgi:hypothetical protein